MNYNFRYSATLIKAGDENSKGIPIRIIPNVPTRDRQNDRIILKAFNQETIDDFLNDGIIDYDHLSVLGETPLIRAQAIIGSPEDLFIDEKTNVPVCDGILHKGNPYVDDVILPALRAKSKVFGASVGGKILKKSDSVDPNTKAKGRDISRIKLKHIAVCPLQKAVHQGTAVSLRKSADGEDVLVFENFDDLVKSIQTGDVLEKALMAGSATGISGISGGQALQGQSLEGVKKIDNKKLRLILPFVLESILNKNVSGGFDKYKKYLLNKGLNENEALEMIKLIARNGSKIVKLTF